VGLRDLCKDRTDFVPILFSDVYSSFKPLSLKNKRHQQQQQQQQQQQHPSNSK
jgi:hypothetical protein